MEDSKKTSDRDGEKMKEKIENLLMPIFGESIKDVIENYYAENNSDELLEFVSHMLRGYFGDKKAESMINALKFDAASHDKQGVA